MRVKARLVVVSLLASALPTFAQAPSPSPSPLRRFQDSVEVARVVLDVRVLDGSGRARRGLTPADLRLTVDGGEVEIEGLQWVDEKTPTVVLPGAATPQATGRLVVFLFQKDLAPSRAPGLLRMAMRAHEAIAGLPPEDHVAVLSFDSHLRLWLDFTTDRARALRAVDEGAVMGRLVAGGGRAGPGSPSLREALDPAAMREAGSLETSLLLIARALAGLPGDRTVVLVGSHMGRDPSTLVARDYVAALRALSAARVAVHSLDVTNADHHTLEFGLQLVAGDTGGFYARTHQFAGAAVERLKGALEGHYVLSFRRPDGPPGVHDVEVKPRHGGGTVLVRPGYRD